MDLDPDITTRTVTKINGLTGADTLVLRNIRSKPRRDSRVVHYIVERRALHHLLPQLLRLFFSKAPTRESGPVSARFGFQIRNTRNVLCRTCGGGGSGCGVHVIRFRGPPENGYPPVGRSGFSAIRIRFVCGSGGPNRPGSERSKSGCHFWERNWESIALKDLVEKWKLETKPKSKRFLTKLILISAVKNST